MKTLLKILTLVLLLPALALADRTITKDEATAAERRIPIYLVDVTDGVTPETGVTISGAECRITKNGDSPATCAGTVVEAENGLYYYQASTGDVDTVGYITVEIADAVARKFVATANISGFDSSTAAPSVNVLSVSANAIEEGDFAARGTAQSATASTLQLASSEAFGDDELNRNTAVHIVSATTGAGQTRAICDYVSSTDTATLCEDWTTTPTGTITYSLVAQSHSDALQATATGRALDVTSTGAAGIDWANVENPTTTLVLSGTTVAVASGVSGNVSGNVNGNVVGTIGGLTAPALKDFFDTDSASTYGAAVAGSVVKEIADNAGAAGSNPTITTGTAQSITTSPPGMRLAASAAYASNTLNDHVAIMILTSSSNTAAEGQVMCVKKNTLTNDVIEFTRGWKSAPSGTVTYAIIPAPNCNAANWPKSR